VRRARGEHAQARAAQARNPHAALVAAARARAAQAAQVGVGVEHVNDPGVREGLQALQRAPRDVGPAGGGRVWVSQADARALQAGRRRRAKTRKTACSAWMVPHGRPGLQAFTSGVSMHSLCRAMQALSAPVQCCGQHCCGAGSAGFSTRGALRGPDDGARLVECKQEAMTRALEAQHARSSPQRAARQPAAGGAKVSAAMGVLAPQRDHRARGGHKLRLPRRAVAPREAGLGHADRPHRVRLSAAAGQRLGAGARLPARCRERQARRPQLLLRAVATSFTPDQQPGRGCA